MFRPVSSIALAPSLVVWFTIAAAAQITTNTNPARTDPNSVSGDLANPGGPGLVTNPANRGPYDPPDHKISDKQFLERAVMRGLTEIEMGKLAAEKASSESLRKLGQTLADDRTKLNARLGRLAGKEGMAVPGSLDNRHQARVDKLAKLSGADFDRVFVKEQADIHERDAQAFLQESQEGADPVIKDFTTKALPAVQDHLVKVRSFEKTKAAKQ